MATGAEIIENALRKLGVIASGEDPSSAEQADGLTALNQLIESLSMTNVCFTDNEETFPLVASQAAYTMGSGGDFDTGQPIKITRLRLSVTSTSPSYELPVSLIELDDWRLIVAKTTQSDIPTACYADYGAALATLNFYPVPNATNSIIINSLKPFQSLSTAGTSLAAPAGFTRMLEYNLAVEIAPEYGIEPSPTIQRIAMESMRNVKRMYQPKPRSKSDFAAMFDAQPYNWLTGE